MFLRMPLINEICLVYILFEAMYVPKSLQNISVYMQENQNTASIYITYVEQVSLIQHRNQETGQNTLITMITFDYTRMNYDNGHIVGDGTYKRVKSILIGDQRATLNIMLFTEIIEIIESGAENPRLNVQVFDCTWDVSIFQPFFIGIAYDMNLRYDCMFIHGNASIVFPGMNFDNNHIAHPWQNQADLQAQ